MSNSKDFQADSYQVGHLTRAIRESLDGDLVFRDEIFPSGIRLRDFTSSQLCYNISGGLQSQITINKNDITFISSQIQDISGVVYSNVSNIENIQTQINNISGASSKFLELLDTPNTYIGYNGYVVTVSGSNLVFVDIDTLLTSVDLSVIQAQIASISGYTLTLQLEVTSINSNIQTISSDLNALEIVVSNLPNLTSEVQTISSDLNALEIVVTDIQSNILGITGGLSQLDEQYVNILGDIMTGDLTIAPLSGSNIAQLNVNSSGKIIRSNYSPIIGGKIDLNIGQELYTITNSDLTSNSNPVCTINAPLSGATSCTFNVFNVTNGSFNVELSMSPPISGYYLNWLSFEL